MLNNIAEPLEDLIIELMKLPSVGPKSAQRLAFHFANTDKKDIDKLCQALIGIKEKLFKCSICGNFSESKICNICADKSRTNDIICVVGDFRDLIAIEKSHAYKGKYHILGGLISPSDGIGPENLNIKSLEDRVENGEVKELIIATNPNVNGETTALYLAKNISKYGIKITRIAYGLPVGYNLEYADDITISRAIIGRREIL